MRTASGTLNYPLWFTDACAAMILTYKLQNEKSAIFGGQSHYQPAQHKRTLQEATKVKLPIKNSRNILFEKSHKPLESTERFNCQCSLHPVLENQFDKEWEKKQWRFDWQSSTQEHYRCGRP